MKTSDYTIEDINHMLIFIKVQNIAHIQYLDVNKDTICTNKLIKGVALYDFITCSFFTIEQVIDIAIQSGWERD